jgi:hypothetical protein
LEAESRVRIACIHVLPLEYYPPAMTMLATMAGRPGWKVRAWTTHNSRGQKPWHPANVDVERLSQSSTAAPLPLRAAGYAAWHLRTAREISRWKPDVIISVEPHSALATWIYYKAFNGTAPLFIHHHEYYAPEDFAAPGMRLLRATRRLEREDLFRRAVWISQTNEHRLRLLYKTNPSVRENVGRVFPNFPPQSWIDRARSGFSRPADPRAHFLYLGSASLEDTFIGDAAAWVAKNPDACTLTITGNNVARSVWQYVEALNAPNITLHKNGWAYDEIPERLRDFDAGLVLYKGNTQNFIYNVPNKVIEYLAGGLEVWYPREMIATGDFARAHPGLRMSEMDFTRLPSTVPTVRQVRVHDPFPFTAESAIAPLLAAIEEVT